MSFRKRLHYLFYFFTFKKILINLAIFTFFTFFNLIFQYFSFQQEFGTLNILLFGNVGILNGAFNGYMQLFYFLPFLFYLNIMDEWTNSPYFLLHSKNKNTVLKSKLLVIVVGTFFYLLLIMISFCLSYLLVSRYVVTKELLTSFDIFANMKLLEIKYLQLLFIGQLSILLKRWFSTIFSLLFILIFFISNLIYQSAIISPFFVLDRTQLIDNAENFLKCKLILAVSNLLIFGISYAVQMTKRKRRTTCDETN